MPNVPELAPIGEPGAGPGNLPSGTVVTNPGTQVSVGAIFPTSTEFSPVGGTVQISGTFPSIPDQPDVETNPVTSTQGYYFLNPVPGGQTTVSERDAFLATPEGQAWLETYETWGSRARIQNPLLFSDPLLSVHPRRRGFYTDRLEHHSIAPTQISTGETMGLFDLPTFTPGGSFGNLQDTSYTFPTLRPSPGLPATEQEDQWWETGLDIVSSVLQPVAGQFLQQAGSYLGSQVFGQPSRPAQQAGFQLGGGLVPTQQQAMQQYDQAFGQGAAQAQLDQAQGIMSNPLFEGAMDLLQGLFPEIGGVANAIGAVTGGSETPMAQVPTALPGGAPAGGSFGAGVACIPPGGAVISQRPSMGMRLPSRVDVPTVDRSGNVRFTTFKNMGRPLLWSGDLAASKRVRKVASKARRAKGR